MSMVINQAAVERCRAIADAIRYDVLQLTYGLGSLGAHIGGALSLVEIMAVLYTEILNITPETVAAETRDRLIFSKGHGTMALYSAMKFSGLLTQEELNTYKTNDTFLYAHPCMNPSRGIEFSSGSLGQGLSLGVGCCLGLQRKHNSTSKVVVILGDGECNEGSIWEAAQSAVQFQCRNLLAIVDYNGLQYDGETTAIMGYPNFEETWKSFGWETIEVDGHDVSALLEAFSDIQNGPKVIIAHTVKGKGISFMENNPQWHNRALSDKEYRQALDEFEVKRHEV